MGVLKSLLLISCQIVLLWLFNEMGYWIVERLGLTFPGNVLGMLLLFLLLWARIIPLKWVERSSALLIRHLALFFIPLAVGLMTYGSLLMRDGIGIILSIVVSTALGIVAAGWVSQRMARKKENTLCSKE